MYSILIRTFFSFSSFLLFNKVNSETSNQSLQVEEKVKAYMYHIRNHMSVTREESTKVYRKFWPSRFPLVGGQLFNISILMWTTFVVHKNTCLGMHSNTKKWSFFLTWDANFGSSVLRRDTKLNILVVFKLSIIQISQVCNYSKWVLNFCSKGVLALVQTCSGCIL